MTKIQNPPVDNGIRAPERKKERERKKKRVKRKKGNLKSRKRALAAVNFHHSKLWPGCEVVFVRKERRVLQLEFKTCNSSLKPISLCKILYSAHGLPATLVSCHASMRSNSMLLLRFLQELAPTTESMDSTSI
jgi:hypothetical protein